MEDDMSLTLHIYMLSTKVCVFDRIEGAQTK